LMEAAKVIALDPYAESPFMEHAIEEGLASEGGELFLFFFFSPPECRGREMMMWMITEQVCGNWRISVRVVVDAS